MSMTKSGRKAGFLAGRIRPIADGCRVLALIGFIVGGASSTAHAWVADTVQELQERIDAAPAGGVVDFAMLEYVEIDRPLEVRKPLTIRRLKLSLPPSLPRTRLVVVSTEGFGLEDSAFRGNADTVGQDQRATLVEISAGGFRVERCRFDNSSKNGLTIEPSPENPTLARGVIRDIEGSGVVRDVVSLSGGQRGGVVRNVLVENVRAVDSSLRGAVEVSDRTWDVTVRGITAERCVYAIDVQDHDNPTDINRNVLLEDIRARQCRHAVRTATDPIGHEGLTIRNVVAEDCHLPIRIDHVANVIVDGVRVVGRRLDPREVIDPGCVIQIKGSRNVTVRDLTIENIGDTPVAVKVIDSRRVLFDRILVEGSGAEKAVVLWVGADGSAAPLPGRDLEIRSGYGPGTGPFRIAWQEISTPDDFRDVAP
jgi:hypothetical protein